MKSGKQDRERERERDTNNKKQTKRMNRNKKERSKFNQINDTTIFIAETKIQCEVSVDVGLWHFPNAIELDVGVLWIKHGKYILGN